VTSDTCHGSTISSADCLRKLNHAQKFGQLYRSSDAGLTLCDRRSHMAGDVPRSSEMGSRDELDLLSLFADLLYAYSIFFSVARVGPTCVFAPRRVSTHPTKTTTMTSLVIRIVNIIIIISSQCQRSVTKPSPSTSAPSRTSNINYTVYIQEPCPAVARVSRPY